MLDRLIRFSLHHRVLVLGTAVLLLVVGLIQLDRTPVDVLPDLSAPTVTVITEVPGFSTEEVETLVSFPLESVLNGIPGLRRLRSISAAGISVVWVEMAWDEDIYRARQLVTERLDEAELPDAAEVPRLGPVASVMGEITFLALTLDPQAEAAGDVTLEQLRRVAEVEVRRAVLAVPGVAQVVPIGGALPRIEVAADPAALLQYRVAVEELARAVRQGTTSTAAGFWVGGEQEYIVHVQSRARRAEDLATAVVRVEDGVPVTVGDVATVGDAPEPRRGTGSYNGRPAVILSVQKQLGANTLDLTEHLDRVVAQLRADLPPGMTLESESFRQADFIERAVGNVGEALRDGAILVVLILLVFLADWRTTLISVLAIPLSLLAAVLALAAVGGTLNTMTLGGLAIAIGALVDDAIIDVENVLRRLREEHGKPPEARRPVLEVVFRASSEVRSAILFATAIIALVFLPLFFLPGLEGRLLAPLGFAYLVALSASFVVSLTVTPVLCSFLLPRGRLLERPDPWLLARLERLYRATLEAVVGRPVLVILAALVPLVVAGWLLADLGRSFLPPFNEGSLTIGVTSSPGVSLEVSDELGRRVENVLLSMPEVVSTTRRTGRAEKDEHVQGVNRSEIEVVLRPGRPIGQLLADIRARVEPIPGVALDIGQPISHRIDHMISGSRTNLAVKIFGPDLAVLRSLARRVEEVLSEQPGIVDLSNQEQASVPQLVVDLDRAALARHGLSVEDVSQTVEALFQGTVVEEVVQDRLVMRVVVRLAHGGAPDLEALAALPVVTPAGDRLPLGRLVRLRSDLGPSIVRRENVARLAMLTANVLGADLAGTVEAARERVAEAVEMPSGYRIVYGGQFEEAAESARLLLILSALLMVGLYGLLYLAFRDARATLIVLVNLPLALIGGVFALALGHGVLSVASLVGFITLFGIATRNGVLLVNRYQDLLALGRPVREAVLQGSRERLAPILMTALTAGLALIPLVLAGGEPGNEIQSPMARVILGGLLSSTFLNLVVVPALFVRWGSESMGRAATPEVELHETAGSP